MRPPPLARRPYFPSRWPLVLALEALAACSGPPAGVPVRPAGEAVSTARAVLGPLVAGPANLDDLALVSVEADEVDVTHVRVQQTLGGVPVLGGEAIVHVAPDGSADVTDDLVPGVVVDTRPRLDRERAIAQTLAAIDCPTCLTAPPEADLWIVRRAGLDRLCWRVSLRREDGSSATSLPVAFVDAATGEIVLRYDDLQTATGSSLYSGTVNFASFARSGTHYLEDHGRHVGTWTSRTGTTALYRLTDVDDVWKSSLQRAAVDAQIGAGSVYDYYLAVHGRRGIDGAGGPAARVSIDGTTPLVTSTVHYGKAFANAFWNGSYMTYGDGDGTLIGPLVTLDICGHEMTHGVTERTAGLVYEGESGALDESWSDVMGAMVERFVRGESLAIWRIGEEAYTPGVTGDALRYLDDPRLGGDPDHYADRYTGPEDNGGVHTNSTIASHAFYLLAHGGTHRRGGSIAGIGADAAARIWYRALASYMTSGTTFKGARAATVKAAASLYGSASPQATAVAKAWSLVGVT